MSLELRKPIYAGVSSKAVDFTSIVSQMDKVNWEVKELMSQHSSYVDVLLRVGVMLLLQTVHFVVLFIACPIAFNLFQALQIFSMKVGTVSERVAIPAAVLCVLWEQIFRFCCRVFVDG